MLRRWLVLAVLLGGLILTSPFHPGPTAAGDPGDGKPAPGPDAAPATVKVTRGPLKVDLVLKATVEAAGGAEVSLRPQAWATPMIVRKAVEHGTPVKKGDVLLQLDTEKIDQTLRDLRAERELSELAVRQAELELPVLEKSLPLDLAAAERANAQAQEDLQRYLQITRPLMQEAEAMSLKSSAYMLETAQEELKQLQKMYRDKDLTEETEEFILKRHRRAVEQAEFFLKQAKIRHEESLKVKMPRQDESTREAAAKASLAWDKARSGLPLAVQQKRLTLAKLKFEQAKATEKLSQLEKDRELFTVRAPADGLAYHGKCQRGAWTTATVSPKLQSGGTVSGEEVIFTIAQPRPLLLRAAVDEKDLHLVSPDVKGRATPTALPDVSLPCHVTAVAAVPQAAGTFDTRLAFDGEPPAALVPGMTCTLKLVPYSKDSALSLPAAAVADEEGEGGGKVVKVPGPGGKPQKKAVKLGRAVGDRVEILDGLSEGDAVLLDKNDKPAEKPADKPTDKPASKTPAKPTPGSQP